jgi:hypothetical protein
MCAVSLYSFAAVGIERDYAFTLTDVSLYKKRGLSGELVGMGSNAILRCLKQTPVRVVSIKCSESEGDMRTSS